MHDYYEKIGSQYFIQEHNYRVFCEKSTFKNKNGNITLDDRYFDYEQLKCMHRKDRSVSILFFNIWLAICIAGSIVFICLLISFIDYITKKRRTRYLSLSTNDTVTSTTEIGKEIKNDNKYSIELQEEDDELDFKQNNSKITENNSDSEEIDFCQNDREQETKSDSEKNTKLFNVSNKNIVFEFIDFLSPLTNTSENSIQKQGTTSNIHKSD